MTARTPGYPTWVDLGTSDLASATAFYTELFGWTAHVSPQPEAGGYTVFNLGGRPVAGAGGLMAPGQPTVWSTYVATADADATTTRVEAAGGKVLVAPFDVMDQGRMAVYVDSAGAPFSVWQPMAMGGAEVFDEPGAVCWNELTTPDPAAAKEFYGAVFGWTAEDGQLGEGRYTRWYLDGQLLGGLMPMVGEAWAGIPPHWMIYFAVADCDATAARAVELGGAAPVAPTDLPIGRFAVLNDPQGAHFSVLSPPA